uniref:Uncharacterized protein n=1 Tax=Arundo donax TaxID=35708 RepID=A0A0A9EV10_ARUDO
MRHPDGFPWKVPRR